MRSINVILFFSIVVFFLSCNSEVLDEHEIGSNLIDETSEVVMVDTFTIQSSTVILDSVLTSDFNSAVFGRYNDEFFGEIKSEVYSLVDLGSSFNRSTATSAGATVNVPIQFDSLAIIAYTDGRYYGDTLQPQTISIHRLTEDLEVPDDQYGLYGHNKFDYDETPLFEGEFYLHPIKQSEYSEEVDSDNLEYKGEGLYFKMESESAVALGKEIVDYVNNEDKIVEESIKWYDFFKGIVIRPGDNNTNMFYLALSDSKFKIRLYYSDTDYSDAGIAKFHDFPLVTSGGNGNKSFVNYSSDRSSTPQDLSRLMVRDEELKSEYTDDLSFVQGGIGMYTKINIPYVENLVTLGLTGGILKAELLAYPKDQSYDDEMIKLPTAAMNVYVTNEDNDFVTPLISSSTGSNLTFNYYLNSQNEDESYYGLSLTSYVNDILINGKEYDDALMIGFDQSGIGNIYDRLVFENNKESDFRMRLKVTYVVQR
ncbi:DUF4270 family protein [Marinifilum sp. RC60d5]|uniref:DUF4270 family protein n=1 Tax=Marinifilum sp. RC60d5 TaxID=3458414 RepID=UPI00403688BF